MKCKKNNNCLKIHTVLFWAIVLSWVVLHKFGVIRFSFPISILISWVFFIIFKNKYYCSVLASISSILGSVLLFFCFLIAGIVNNENPAIHTKLERKFYTEFSVLYSGPIGALAGIAVSLSFYVFSKNNFSHCIKSRQLEEP